MKPADLERLGTLLYGPRFHGQLIAALTEIGPQKAHAANLTGWLAGTRPIPAWVASQGRALALKGQVDLAQRSAALAELTADPEALVHTVRSPGSLARLKGQNPEDAPIEPDEI